MSARKVPKVSGLLSMGKLQALSPGEVSGLPTFSAEEPLEAPPQAQLADLKTNDPAGILILPVTKLRASPYNVRKIRTQERIQEIGQSLLERQHEPITVYRGTGADAGFFMIISGVTRLKGAIEVGKETLEARIDENIDLADPLSIVKASHIHNNTAPETDLDHATIAKELQEAGFTQLQVAMALGYKNNRQITRLNAYFELPESVMKIGTASPDKFPAAIAEIMKSAVAKLGEEVAAAILTTAFAKNLSRREIEMMIDVEQRKAIPGRQRTRATRDSNTPINVGGKAVGAMRVLVVSPDKKRVHLDADLAPAVADELHEKLKTLLKEFAESTKNV